MEFGLPAYLAGFFDGEGCIWANQSGIRLQIGQINPAPLKLFAERYGIPIYRVRRDNRKASYRDVYTWQTGKHDVIRTALTEWMPYLTVKRDEAIVALQFLDTYDVERATDDIKQLRAELADRLRFLKRRDYSPEALAEAKAEEYFAEAI